MGDHGAQRFAAGHHQGDFGVDRAIDNAADFAPQLIARGGFHLVVGQQQNRRGLHQRVQLLAHVQLKILGRFAGDHRHQLVIGVQAQAHFVIDIALAQRTHRAGKLVARAAAHRHALEQLAELGKITVLAAVHIGGQTVQRGLIFAFQRAVQRHHFFAIRRQRRAAAVPPASHAGDQRMLGQIVHGVDGVPRRLVRQGHRLGRLRNRAMLGNGFQQADAGVAQKRAQLGVHFQLAAQAW